MKIYLDIVFIINYLMDYNILDILNKVLKRNVTKKRLLFSSLIGSITIFFLFLNINKYMLILLKLILAIIINLICFGFHDSKYLNINLIYFYMISTIYGGILFIIKQNSINNYFYIILILLFIPIISNLLVKIFNKRLSNYNYYYITKIYFNNNKYIELPSFLDTGNKLIDPYTNKGIIIVNKNKVSNMVDIRSPIYVPYKTVNNTGLIKCFKPVAIEINNSIYKNYLIGLSEDNINIDGIDCILNYRLLEELNV